MNTNYQFFCSTKNFFVYTKVHVHIWHFALDTSQNERTSMQLGFELMFVLTVASSH